MEVLGNELKTSSRGLSPVVFVGYVAMFVGLGAIFADAVLSPQEMGALTPVGILAVLFGYPASQVK